MMIRKHHALLSLLSIAFISSFLVATPALAGTKHNVYGWAWSSNIGWISFNNCSNPTVPGSCSGVDYGVSISNTGDMLGYAWSPSIGWIRFGGLDPSGSDGGIFPIATGNTRSDAVLNSNNQIYGWARACEVYKNGCSGSLKDSEVKVVDGVELGGWDGWISLRGNPGYGITKSALSSSGTLTISALRGFAWGALNLGWIKFDSLTTAQAASVNGGCPGVCMVTTRTVTPAIQLNTLVSGSGKGTVSGTGINCGTDCSESFPISPVTQVTLTATADPGSTFDGWVFSSNTSTCTQARGTEIGTTCSDILMNESKIVAAKFSKKASASATLTVDTDGRGKGTVSGSRINCGKNCSESFTITSPATKVTLTATADSKSTFDGWASTCTQAGGTENRSTCSDIPMDKSKTVTARFDLRGVSLVTLTVDKKGDGSGTVSGSGINCGTNCSGSFFKLSPVTKVTLTATADSKSTFDGWASTCTQAGGTENRSTCSDIPMDKSKTVTARFIQNTVTTDVCREAVVSCTKMNSQGSSVPCSEVHPIITINTASATLVGSPTYSISTNRTGVKLDVSNTSNTTVGLIGEFSSDGGQTWEVGEWTSTDKSRQVSLRLKLTNSNTQSSTQSFNLNKSVNSKVCDPYVYYFRVDNTNTGNKSMPQ